MVLSSLVTARTQILHQKSVYHPSINHELFSLDFIFDFFNKFTRITLHLIAFEFYSIALLQTSLILLFEIAYSLLKTCRIIKLVSLLIDFILNDGGLLPV